MIDQDYNPKIITEPFKTAGEIVYNPIIDEIWEEEGD